MKKIHLFLIIAFLSIYSASALEIIYPVNQTNYNFSVIYNQSGNFYVTLRNNENRTIHNITANPLYPYTFSTIGSIEINKTANLSFAIKTNEVFGFSPFYPTFIESFAETYVEMPKVINISIDSSPALFNPSNITINVMDTVCWKNTLNQTHKVKSIGQSLFDNLVNTTFCYQFTQIYGQVEYYDELSGHNGYVNVISNIKNVLAHDPTKDITGNIIIESKYMTSQLEVENYINQFDISYDGEAQGAFRLLNKFNQTIHNLKFDISSPIESQIIFIPAIIENFEVDKTQVIIFKILPKITQTDQTNKSYNYNLIIRGDNIMSQSFPLSIYVKQHLFELNYTGCPDMEALRIFCSQNPNSPICIGFPRLTEKENVTIYVEKQWNRNVTQRDVDNVFTLIEDGTQTFTRLENRWKSTEGIVNNCSDLVMQTYIMINETRNECVNYKERADNAVRRERITYIIFFVALVLSITAYFILKPIIRNYQIKKNMGSGS